MGFVNKAVLAASCIATAAAVNVKVRSSGGNSTKHFGVDYGYGFLHEDINNSGDGGIYAELIQNRAFQFSDAYPVNTDHYQSINGASLSIQFLGKPLSDALPASMRVSSANASGPIGFENEGYWGMDVKASQEYTGSFWVKGAYKGSFTAAFKSNLTDDVFGSVEIASKSVANDWTEHAFTLQPSEDAPSSNNTFAVTFDPAVSSFGCLDFVDSSLTMSRALPTVLSISTLLVSSLPPTRVARTVFVSISLRLWRN
jgi:alpha-N-arabinofuranosidase